MRKIKITFVKENVSAIAVLLDEKAPKTCNMIWKLLESPIENYGIHAKWTGAEISFGVPEDRLPQKSGFVPPENQTVIPIPGDLIWNAYEPYQWLGNPLPVYIMQEILDSSFQWVGVLVIDLEKFERIWMSLR